MARGFNERQSDFSVPARSKTKIDVFLGHPSKMAPIRFEAILMDLDLTAV